MESERNLDLLESEIKSLFDANKQLIEKIEKLKSEKNKIIKHYNVVQFKNPLIKLREPLSLFCEEIIEEESFADYVENWVAPTYLEKPEDADPDKLLYGDHKELMNMKCENFEDLVRINKQISVTMKYLSLLRESASYAFGMKFKKNFEKVGNFLKIIIRDFELNEKETQNTKTIEIKSKIQEVNNLFSQLFIDDSILNNAPFKLKLNTKILTKPLINLLYDMLDKKKKAFNMIYEGTNAMTPQNFDAVVKNRGTILVIFKNKNHYIFGAYIVDKWSGAAGGWKEGSKKSFLFTFGLENKVQPFKLLYKGDGNYSNITTGGLHVGTDLVAFSSYSCTPKEFIVIEGNPDLPVTHKLLAGSKKWKPDLFELFEEV